MKVLFVVNAEVIDRELLDEYRALTRPILVKHGARVLAASNDADVVEGQPLGRRVVVVEFPSRAAFEAWHSDPEYAPVLEMRLRATNGAALVVDERE